MNFFTIYVFFRVGGRSYIFRTDTVLLCREPNSLLAALIRADHPKRMLLMDGYCEKKNEYYIERNVQMASYVTDYFLTGHFPLEEIWLIYLCLGKLHKPMDVCWNRFRDEIKFWRLGDVQVQYTGIVKIFTIHPIVGAMLFCACRYFPDQQVHRDGEATGRGTANFSEVVWPLAELKY